MLRLSIGFLASAVAIAPLPLMAQDGSAEDLGDVMSINLKDVVKSTCGFQGARTPNQAGIGGFLPSLLMITAFDSLMPWSTPTSLIVRVIAASSTPKWMAPRSAPHHGLVTAGSMVTALGCMG